MKNKILTVLIITILSFSTSFANMNMDSNDIVISNISVDGEKNIEQKLKEGIEELAEDEEQKEFLDNEEKESSNIFKNFLKIFLNFFE